MRRSRLNMTVSPEPPVEPEKTEAREAPAASQKKTAASQKKTAASQKKTAASGGKTLEKSPKKSEVTPPAKAAADEITREQTAAWNRHYSKEKGPLTYPDENLVRLLNGASGERGNAGSGAGPGNRQRSAPGLTRRAGVYPHPRGRYKPEGAGVNSLRLPPGKSVCDFAGT